MKLGREQFLVPAGVESELVVRNHVGAALRRGFTQAWDHLQTRGDAWH